MFNVRLYLLCLVLIAGANSMRAQLVCLNCSGRDTTSYTNGLENDSLYFICSGESASLRVFWSTDELRNVQWYRFISSTNSWLPITNQQQVSFGSYTASNGGYRVVVSNVSGEVILEDICWISRVTVPPIVNANTIQPGCGVVQLAGLFWTGNVGGYYNPPPTDFNDVYVYNENTTIEICLDINHPVMADLRIELVTPPACGSNSIILTEAQTILETDTVCFGENATNLCFGNAYESNYFLCDLPYFDITGNFGSYGVQPQPIDWAQLEGCDITAPGWQLNVFDCYEGAQGSVISASMTISDDTMYPLYVQQFDPVDGPSYLIPDVGCADNEFASIVFERYYPTSSYLGQNIGVMWEADPPFDFAGAANQLYITLNNGPQQDTYFTFSLRNIQLGEACGAISSDVEFYDYIPPDSSLIELTDSILCLSDAPLLLTSSYSLGSWGGPVEATADSAYFNPAEVGEGVWTVSFDPVSSCIQPTEVQVYVYAAPNITLGTSDAFCSTAEPAVFEAMPVGGIWSGLGIIDSLAGVFDPGLVNDGVSIITYTAGDYCPAQASFEADVELYVPLDIVQSDSIRLCETGPIFDFNANLPGTTWTGEGISSASQGFFNPLNVVPGAYMVVAHYQEACEDTDSTWVIVENGAIEFESPTPVCVDADSIQLNVSAPAGVWSGQGVIDSLQGIVNAQLLGAGNHFFTYSLLNSCATVDSVELTIEDFPMLMVALPEGICFNQNAIELSSNFEGGTYYGVGVEQQGNQWYFNPLIAGVGIAEIEYAYSDVCSLSYYDSVEVYPLPELEITADTIICPEGQALLQVTGASQYSWTPAQSLDTPNQSFTIAEPDVTTTYTASGQSEQGCFSFIEVTVDLYTSPSVTTNGPLELCYGESDALSVEGLTNALWSGPNIESPNELTTLVSPQETTLYTVSGTDENGCIGESSAELIIYEPQAFFIASDTLGVPPLEIELTNLSQGDYFVWDLGNGDTLISTDLSEMIPATYQGEQIHTITLTAYLHGCPQEYSLSIVTYYDSELLIVPNVVTPNGDSKNDTWWVKTQNMELLHVDIFNRWGNLVGVLDGISDKWDPADAPEGTYYYRLTAFGLDGEGYNQEGQFTVLRSEN